MRSHPLHDLVNGFEGRDDLGYEHPAVDLVGVHGELGLDAGGARVGAICSAQESNASAPPARISSGGSPVRSANIGETNGSVGSASPTYAGPQMWPTSRKGNMSMSPFV